MEDLWASVLPPHGSSERAGESTTEMTLLYLICAALGGFVVGVILGMVAMDKVQQYERADLD